jgi:hypothetical protein
MSVVKKESLIARYSPEVLAIAEGRREKLAYEKIKVGNKSSPRVSKILEILFQAHQNYYLEHFQATCILSSVLFEQAVLFSLEKFLNDNGSISMKVRGSVTQIETVAELSGYSLLHLVGSAVFHGIVPRSHSQLAQQIRFFRNLLMHQDLPPMEVVLDKYRASYEMETDSGFRETRFVEVSKMEVARHCISDESDEIWAYYLLMRVRELMSVMFAK